jgi:cbb3-type cytochrome oxidase cytochrome c subunit
LTNVGSRLPYETIEKVLTDPRSVNPQGIMPSMPLSHEEMDALGRFLAQLK